MYAEALDEYCPNCGKAAKLNAVSGFCINCTKAIWPNKAVCDTCGRIEERGQFRTKCQSCQTEEWLGQYANKLEAYMAIGLTFSMAVIKVQYDNRPICLCCGNKIKGGTRGRHFFCRSNPNCRSAGIKFHHLIHKYSKSKEQALTETINWMKQKGYA